MGSPAPGQSHILRGFQSNSAFVSSSKEASVCMVMPRGIC